MIDVEKLKERLKKLSPDKYDRDKQEDEALSKMTQAEREEYWEGQREAAEQADFMWKSQEAIYGKGGPYHVPSSNGQEPIYNKLVEQMGGIVEPPSLTPEQKEAIWNAL